MGLSPFPPLKTRCMILNFSKKICSFTGYRTQKLNEIMLNNPIGIEKINALIEDEIKRLLNEDFIVFKSGMAIGSDTIFAEAVLRFKNIYPRIKLVAVVPCLEQEKLWSAIEKEKYFQILKKADEVEIISKQPYFNGCMQIRNRSLVDNCDELLAVFDGRHGGTMHTINYAKKIKRKVTILDPVKLVKLTLLG